MKKFIRVSRISKEGYLIPTVIKIDAITSLNETDGGAACWINWEAGGSQSVGKFQGSVDEIRALLM